jgi:iron(III) transport system ATP-binding protein
MSSVSLRNVEKNYGRDLPSAVQNLSLDIPESEFLCLLGPSGCGKTTTLRMIAGLEHPTAGQILVDGKPVDSVEEGIFTPPERRGMGLVFQNYALWPHLTVQQNIEFGLKLRKVEKAERAAIASRVMETLAIGRYGSRYPSELSGGQQQRVALARMLAVNPSVILLDEPLSNLDAKLRLDMRAELKRIHRELGSTFIFVTHDQWEAMTLSTTVAVMSEGQLQQVGTPDDIYERPANRFVAEFVGNLPINIVTLADADPVTQWMHQYLSSGAEKSAAVSSVGIRPENVHIAARGQARPATAPVTAEATLVDVVPTGGNWIAELVSGERKVFALTAEPPQLSAGETVAFWAEPRHLHLFDGSGMRVA